ncbi:MAG: hypothetical protein RL033_7817 [Pseudomonadota bacterium]|jgi:pimeloyl-ACP methyl ester carboxylesterase
MTPRDDYRRSVLAGLGLAVAAVFLPGCSSQPANNRSINVTPSSSAVSTSANPVKAGHAAVNGISLYYELHGSAPGTPLLLLHGGGSSIDVTYGRILPHLAERRRVLALDEQAHGRSSDRAAPVRFTSSADDAAELLRQLDVERVDVMGFSNGASVALQLALRHPERVRKLIFASSMTKRSGAAPQFWQFMAAATFADMPQPLKDAFLQQNPDPQKLRAMHDKDLERMRNFAEVSDEEVRSVQAPTLVLAGDRDVPTPEHCIELTHLFPHARLMILPGGHGDYLGELLATRPGDRAPELTAGLITSFLDAPPE